MIDQIFYTEGAGNKFFFTMSEKLSFLDMVKMANEKGLRPDGFIFSKRVNKTQLTFDFYNNDGSKVDFCGNALRAVGVCYNQISSCRGFYLKTNVGNLKIDVRNKTLVEAQMPVPESKGVVRVDKYEVPCVLSGVLHLVFDESLFGIKSREEMRGFCGRVRRMDLGEAQAYNLTFYKPSTKDPIHCVTFERGVEDFTLACGSGALSVAQVMGVSGVTLKMPGGLLKVSRRGGEVFMLGSAKIIGIY